MRLLFAIIFMLTVLRASAQTPAYTWEDFAERMTEVLADEEGMVDVTLDYLYELHLNPQNINNAKEEDFLALPFMNATKALAILQYIERNGGMETLGELMLITKLSADDRLMLRLFFYADNTEVVKGGGVELRKLLKYSKNELSTRTDIPLYRRAGFYSYDDSTMLASPNKRYRGERLYHNVRYTFESQNHVYAGFQLEKDPGERGIDYYAGYAMLRDIQLWRGGSITVIGGTYRASFGLGLAVNSGVSFGKAMTLSGGIGTIDRGFTRHSSMSESGYFTGGGVTLRIGRMVSVSAFVSNRDIDGTMTKDSTGVTTIVTSGYHRTPLEHSKRGNITSFDAGGNIHVDLPSPFKGDNGGLFQFSLTAIATRLSLPLKPKIDTDASLYRLFNARGTDFQNYSVSYAYRNQHITFSGETALSSADYATKINADPATRRQVSVATLNMLQWSPGSLNTFTVIQRYYPIRYNAINGRAFSENSRLQNESGVYVGWNTRLIPRTVLDAYVDVVYFPWLRSNTTSSTYCFDAMLQGNVTLSKKHSLLVRYKYKNNHSLKLQLNSQLTPSWSLKSTITGCLAPFKSSATDADLDTIPTPSLSTGFAISEAVRWSWSSKGRIDASLAYFNTDSYDARVYGYESTLRYAYGLTSYYYKGLRATLMATVPLFRHHLFLVLKASYTQYFDRDKIGSAQQLIEQSHKEDIQTQIVWKF